MHQKQQLDATELRAHNSQFTAYEGRQKGSEVKALLAAIQNNNSTYEDRRINVNFCINGGDVSDDGSEEENELDGTQEPTYTTSEGEVTMSALMKKVKSATTYNVVLETNGVGLITLCDIEVYKSSTGGSDTTD